MTSSLVGSEMCIRDRELDLSSFGQKNGTSSIGQTSHHKPRDVQKVFKFCLLYTSDAADDM
eukprot:2565311-Prorocentrum_lima.AAC.1